MQPKATNPLLLPTTWARIKEPSTMGSKTTHTIIVQTMLTVLNFDSFF